MDGILPLYKPRGMTSNDCIFKVRKLLKTKKVGHTGTLDPNVDGVLPICIGQATKVVPELVASGKIYTGEITLGFATTTEDLDGEIIAEEKLTRPFSDEQIDAILASFIGRSTQIPPMYSAVKVNGRRLYDYARAGDFVERPTRQIEITSFERVGASQFDLQTGQQKFAFTVACSKGTYIRTLAVDFGRKLNLPAVMSDLTRLKSGGITIGQCVSLEQLQEHVENQTLVEIMQPMDLVFKDLPQVTLTDEQWSLLNNGVFMVFNQHSEPQIALNYQGHLKATYKLQDAQKALYRPDRMYLQNHGIASN